MAVQGKRMKRIPKVPDLIPNYLGARREMQGTDPKQRAEYAAFKVQLNAVQGKE